MKMLILKKSLGEYPEILRITETGLQMLNALPRVIADDLVYLGYDGGFYIAANDHGKPSPIQDLDKALDAFEMTRYSALDKKRCVWQCRNCGHIAQFEADGPYENGWNVCPACARKILIPKSAKGL